MKLFPVSIFMILFFIIQSAHAETWSFQFSGGTAYNVRTPLRIEQAGEDVITADARYGTRPWKDSPYYAVRIGRWDDERSWELELVHHKLYLKNAPPDVQNFELSHGFNLLTLNRAWRRQGIIYRVGLGAVIAYPDKVTVRGSTQSGKYQIAGPTAQVAFEKRFYFKKRFFAALEGKLTASYANIDIAGGEADVKNVAAHALFGFGIEF